MNDGNQMTPFKKLETLFTVRKEILHPISEIGVVAIWAKGGDLSEADVEYVEELYSIYYDRFGNLKG